MRYPYPYSGLKEEFDVYTITALLVTICSSITILVFCQHKKTQKKQCPRGHCFFCSKNPGCEGKRPQFTVKRISLVSFALAD